MKKLLLILILSMMSGIVFAENAARSSVYQLTTLETGKQRRAEGTAVIFRPNWMLTSAHNIPAEMSNPRVFVRVNGNLIPAHIEKIDRRLDLALLHLEIKCPCVPVAATVPPKDSETVLIGYPYPPVIGVQILTTGLVQGISNARGSDKLIITAGAQAGSSGGGAFVANNNVWELVGIAESILPEPGITITFLVPSAQIRTFLQGTPAEI